MAQIDLRDTETRQQLGLFDGTVAEQSQQRLQRHKGQWRGRLETQRLILEACAYHEQTRLQIARTLGRAKTPHLVALIEGMVADGLLVCRTDTMPNGIMCFYYRKCD